MNRPTAGSVEERTALDTPATIDGRRLRGLIPYNVESRDLGGWREVIDPGALTGADLSELIATREHDRSRLLGRHPNTLSVEDRADGFAWAVELPQSPVGEDVRVAVERGDLRSTSWRMVVAKDRWEGNVRHVEAIRELRDVTVTAAPAYGDAAAVEYRSTPESSTTPPSTPIPAPAGAVPQEENPVQPEDRHEAPQETATGGLQVEDRVTVTADRPRGLAEEFRSRGFPAEIAVMGWDEYEQRAVTWTGSVDNVNQVRRAGVGLPFDQRYAWPAFGRVGVDAGVTSVQVMQQTARTLAAAADVVRDIDETTDKPETDSTLTVATVPMNQVANVQAGIPNVLLETATINTTIENDLRLALAEGLDKIVIDEFAASGFQAPSTDPFLVSVRKALTTLTAAGYAGDTLILTPAAAETLDLLRATATAGEQYYIWGAGEMAPNSVFRLNIRVSKTVAAPVVVDSAAFGKLYASPVSLARFEENAGKTNTSLIRLEGHAAFGVERQAAAIRIAAS